MPDFAVNTLGTCKQIEAFSLRLRKRHGHMLESKAYARSYASISLQYGEMNRCPVALAGWYFTEAGATRSTLRCRGGAADPIF